jgi:Dolichyl-phosphate-mannose-protein mannosyltransferase
MRARWALAGAVLAALVAYGSLAALATTPRIFYDELLYMEASDSLASGDGLEVRGGEYDRGVLYPVLLAPLLAVAPDREVGYLLAKLLNALLFALTAIPVYLLARRLLPRRHSVVVAGLALAIPSSVYVSVVMTEAVSYLAASWAILAIVLAVERPTPVLQGGALLAIGVAFLARPQFAALYPAYLLALAIALWLLPDRRTRLRRSLRALWPTVASLVLALGLLVVVPALRGDSPFGALGEYETSARAPDLIEVGQWLVYHVAGLGLYLAVVPFAVAPIVLASWLARARRGSERHASMLASFASINAAALAIVAYVVGGYERTGLGIDRLHDRYLFYVVPLWLVLLAAWAAEGAPKPRRVAAIGAAMALVLTLLLPYGELEIENGVKLFSAVGTAFPAAVVEIAGSALVARFVVLVLAALLLAGVLFRPGRRARLAVATVLAVFLFNGLLVWARAFNPPEEAVFAGSLERRWVDESVGDGSVAVLSTPCEDGVLARDSLSLTEFFNSSIGPVVEIGGEFPTGRVGRGGQIVGEAGRPLGADYAVAQPGVALAGERVADGTNAGLVLWHVGGRVRVVGAASGEDLTRAACG